MTNEIQQFFKQLQIRHEEFFKRCNHDLAITSPIERYRYCRDRYFEEFPFVSNLPYPLACFEMFYPR